MQLLGNLSPETFLRDYWQKKPLLIRQAIPGFLSPLSPEELAGLACEEDVESRLIFENAGGRPWHLETGPFDEQRFAALPDSHWTLLVQKANQLLPELAEFLQTFDFVPGWRIDDVMISYAPVDGSVGPHQDQYDVFLLQGLGSRRWQINTGDFTEAGLVEGTPLKILQTFEAEQEWILQPGDMLYLPPNVAHYGIALDDCMTYSIGFRAPSHAEMLTAWVDDHVTRLQDSQRYTDPDLVLQDHPGEITAAALRRVQTILLEQVSGREQNSRWFGRFITEPAAHLAYENRVDTPLNDKQFEALLQQADALYRSEFSRFAFIRHPADIGLYVDGVEISLGHEHEKLVALICDQRVLPAEQLTPLVQRPEALNLLTRLYNFGALWFGDETDED